jgi:hypothetical protein
VLHTWANGDGTQRIEDTGPLTKKRMETCDGEFRDTAVDSSSATSRTTAWHPGQPLIWARNQAVI